MENKVRIGENGTLEIIFKDTLIGVWKYIYDIYRKWSVTEEDEKYEYYMDFLKAVANISYFTMSNFTKFQTDRTLDNIDLLDLAIKVWMSDSYI